ncbi:hypothetical protein SFMTTN_1234 [Sulfuriferula multivorans]|uniref:Uncharacterized protein n=1 Tax=Sulfuriferula multivorans TaxID=1559896 RepID=A0A401JCW3_9PROT|nr:hypothetical protein SFMTTN_1234 [Sulfuriferula multivorans]
MGRIQHIVRESTLNGCHALPLKNRQAFGAMPFDYCALPG